ncbi:hypothetical protein LP416_00195 [Polaromonas sp. P2-4]|nr:hypothetical protein LP416_00195 [Polaromonas sp. P2-4]
MTTDTDKAIAERRARMREMLDRSDDPAHQREVQAAGGSGQPPGQSQGEKAEWEQTDDRRIPSEKGIRDAGLDAATQKHDDLVAQLKVMRGDYTDLYPAPQNADAQPQAEKLDTMPARPMQRAAAQDADILAMLKCKGFDPLALPRNETGKPGVKAEIRNALGQTGLWAGATVFDKAWERLRRNRDIADKD